MVNPNLFIVGAAKSGTSTLWYNLKDHPDIFLPEDELYKEPKFFSPLAKPKRQEFEDYLAIFRNQGDKQYRGEASTAYLTDPYAADNIYQFNPKAKIIIILRNPADRAYSLYKWMVQEGYEYVSTFQKALNKEPKRKLKTIPNFWEPEYYYNYLYFNSGLYAEQVDRYLTRFGTNTLILRFEDLKQNPEKIKDQIFNFLGLQSFEFSEPYVNPGKSVIAPKFQFFLRKVIKYRESFYKEFLKQRVTEKARRDRLMEAGLLNSNQKKMEAQTRDLLLNHYKPNIEKLSDQVQVDFTYWLKG